MPTCSQPKCGVAVTGACLKGHEQPCPHLVPDGATSGAGPIEPIVAATALAGALQPYRFHSGEKLTVSEASRVMNERAVRMVFCVGAQRAGKTTFLARLGEMFRKGLFRRVRFAGSKTLCAFERATWLATIPSGAVRPDTSRTQRRENDTFLHLRVHPEGEPWSHSDILISDLAGETFPEAVASREFCAAQRALVRADHLVLFLDCDSLVGNAKRHSEFDNALGFLRQVAAVKHDPELLHVHVVFSRWDYVTRHAQRQTHEDFCKLVETKLSERYGNSFASLKFWRIAARPVESPPTDAAIQDLFSAWLETSPTAHAPTVERINHPARDFSAFGEI